MIPNFRWNEKYLAEEPVVRLCLDARQAEECRRILKFETKRGSGYAIKVTKRTVSVNKIRVDVWIVTKTKRKQPDIDKPDRAAIEKEEAHEAAKYD